LLYEQDFLKDTFTSSASLDLRSATGSAHNRIKRREYVSVRAVLTPVPPYDIGDDAGEELLPCARRCLAASTPE
jgi:hypothetical protein